MSTTLTTENRFTPWSAQNWRIFASIACALCCSTFLLSAALFLFPPSDISGGPALNAPALILAFVATLCGGAGIFGFNRYAALNADDQFIALWTNLLSRVMVMVQLFAFGTVLFWTILHFIGLPAISQFHH